MRWIIPVVLAAGLALVVCVGGGVLFVMRDSSDSSGDDKPAGATSRRVERPGYQNVDEAVADPKPLVEKLDAPAVSHANVPVVPACALLSLADLDRNGMLLKPDPLGAIYKREYIDGQGTGPIAADDPYSLPTSPVNSCQYLGVDKTLVRVEVFQESYANPRALTAGVARFEEQPPIKSVSVRRKKQSGSDKKHVTYSLRLGKTLAVVAVASGDGGDAEPLQQKLLPTIAANLEARSASPIGNPVLSYDSPAFTATAVNACASVKPEDFQALFSVAPAPIVEEELATAVGLLNYSLGGTGISDTTDWPYFDAACKRSTGQSSITERLALQIRVRNYDSDKPAKYDMTFSKAGDGGQPLAQPVGDESYVVTKDYARAPGAVVFRKGRLVVTVTMTDPKQVATGVDPPARAAELAPVASQIAARLTG